MRCPRCNSASLRVVDSREGADERSVRRRRQCEDCSHRFTTFERIEERFPLIVKKGGQRESYDRDKVLKGLQRACEKRPVTIEQMEVAVRSIELKLLEKGMKEIESREIGDLLIEQLRDLDQVAYVRFASVYREFSDVQEFKKTLDALHSAKS